MAAMVTDPEPTEPDPVSTLNQSPHRIDAPLPVTPDMSVPG
jgi:hypothetical protein